MLIAAALISAGAFLYYGAKVLAAPRLEAEFERYGIPDLRTVVGVLEILGACGLLLGLAVPPLGAAAAAGLATLMVLGVAVRIRLRDPLVAMVPAAVLAGLNSALVVAFLNS